MSLIVLHVKALGQRGRSRATGSRQLTVTHVWREPQDVFTPIAVEIADVGGEVAGDRLRKGEYLDIMTRVVREVPHLLRLGVLQFFGAKMWPPRYQKMSLALSLLKRPTNGLKKVGVAKVNELVVPALQTPFSAISWTFHHITCVELRAETQKISHSLSISKFPIRGVYSLSSERAQGLKLAMSPVKPSMLIFWSGSSASFPGAWRRICERGSLSILTGIGFTRRDI